MNLKKLTTVAFVAASIIAGASSVSAAPSMNVNKTYISISEDCSEAVLTKAKADFEAKSGEIAKTSLNLNKISKEEALKAFETFSGVKTISLNGIEVGNLDFIKNLPNLEEITITYDSKFEPLDISALKDNTKLTKVYISSAKVQDLSPISNCTGLTTVTFYSCNILSNTIKPLGTLTNVKELCLYGCNIDDFAHLATMSSLKKINIYATKPNKDAELNYDHLSEIKSLEDIKAGLTEMKSLAFMKDLPNVKNIEFLAEKLEDYETLENCKSLESIMYWAHNSMDLDGNKMGKAQSLKKFKIWSTKNVINWEGLSNLTNLEDLKILTVKECNSPETAIDTSFMANMPKLKEVQYSEVQIKDLAKLGPAVERIELNKINNKDEKPLDLSTMVAANAKNLVITDTKVANAESLVKNCPKLERLTLTKVEGITNYDFLKELPERSYVTLTKGAITEEFQKELKETKKINVSLR